MPKEWSSSSLTKIMAKAASARKKPALPEEIKGSLRAVWAAKRPCSLPAPSMPTCTLAAN